MSKELDGYRQRYFQVFRQVFGTDGSRYDPEMYLEDASDEETMRRFANALSKEFGQTTEPFEISSIEDGLEWVDYAGALQTIFSRSFGRQINEFEQDTTLSSFATKEQLRIFCADLEAKFSSEVQEGMLDGSSDIYDLNSWARFNGSNLRDKDSGDLGFTWESRITKFQSFFLTASSFLGFAITFVGAGMMTQTKKYGDWGGTLFAFGLFLTAQMYWGIMGAFNWLEKRKSKLLRLGYAKLFWLMVITAYVLDVIGGLTAYYFYDPIRSYIFDMFIK